MSSAHNFRINLVAILEAREITQTDLAAFAGMKRPYISRIISGDTVPMFDQADRIASALGLTTEDLIKSPAEFRNDLLTPA